jgi:GT2 family glycosyltransferase
LRTRSPKSLFAQFKWQAAKLQIMDDPHYQYDITVSIVAYRSDSDELEQAIRSLSGTSLRILIVIVDNSPTEELGPFCRSLGAEYIHTGKNLGFGAGHNIAIKKFSTSRYHLVLNPDVKFEPKVLEELVAFLELNESVGLVMPRVIYPDGSPQNLCKRLPTPFDVLARRTFPRFLKRVFRGRLSRFEFGDMDMNKVLSVPFLSGCFMLLRREVLDDIGIFDDRFFMYFEDVDLTRRIHQKYNTLYYPGVAIIHRHEKGSYKSKRILLYSIQSAFRYFNKWGWIFDRDRDRINNEACPVKGIRFPVIEN